MSFAITELHRPEIMSLLTQDGHLYGSLACGHSVLLRATNSPIELVSVGDRYPCVTCADEAPQFSDSIMFRCRSGTCCTTLRTYQTSEELAMEVAYEEGWRITAEGYVCIEHAPDIGERTTERPNCRRCGRPLSLSYLPDDGDGYPPGPVWRCE